MDSASHKKLPQVSIITPVYNADRFLNECVGGILAQSFRSFELVLIDDGSTDGSGALCDAYAEQDPRVRVIHQPNGGVSRARNRGLDEAQGKYVVFVDADDLLEPDYLQDLIQGQQAQEGTGRTMILSDYQPFSEKGPEKRSFPAPFTMDFRTGEGLTAEHFRELIFQFRLFPPYCKLFRRDVIEEQHIRFREGMRSAEDFEFNVRYLAAVDRLVYIDSVQYDYRVGYKRYVPSNRGVLGESEIKSAHIMAHGITELAERMGIRDEIQPEIDRWAANKHYYNRLRMLFGKGEGVGLGERKKLYQALIADPVYYEAARRGASMLERSATRTIAEHFDCFSCWHLFYGVHGNKTDKR